MTDWVAGVNTDVYGRGVTERLNKADWIEQGLETLRSHGPGGLKVGPMAAALKVSRGSFYWHFRDIADFRAQLLKGWRERTTGEVIRSLEARATPDRLRTLLRRAFQARPDVDIAIRTWAAHDPEAAAAVAAVDQERIAYITGLLAEARVDGEQAAARARFLYWAHLGRPLVMAPDHAALTETALDEISDLFER